MLICLLFSQSGLFWKLAYRKVQFLVPCYYLIFINEIVVNLNTNITLFADDTSLYMIIDTPQNAALQLNNDLSKIHIWVYQLVNICDTFCKALDEGKELVSVFSGYKFGLWQSLVPRTYS